MKFKKCLLAAFVFAVLCFSFSICSLGAAAASIERLSIENGVLLANVSGENVSLYAAKYDGAFLSEVYCAEPDSYGNIKMNIASGDGYSLYLWNKATLSPLSLPYSLRDGRAYAEGETSPVASFTDYSFDQSANIVIVTSVSPTLITGYQAGVEKSFPLDSSVKVLGLSNSFEDIVPGCVILPSVPVNGQYNAVELLASIGIPVDPELFRSKIGSYQASDGSAAYKNIISKFYTRSGSTGIYGYDDPDGSTKSSFRFESGTAKVYRVGIAVDEDGNIDITVTPHNINASGDDYPFKATYAYHNYVYMRYKASSERITEAVLYLVPTNFNPGAGDGEYSPIFNSGGRIILE